MNAFLAFKGLTESDLGSGPLMGAGQELPGLGIVVIFEYDHFHFELEKIAIMRNARESKKNAAFTT
jgi:hypothetical protein